MLIISAKFSIMDTKTNFQKVQEFHQAFDMPSGGPIRPNVIQDDPNLAKLRLSLITEEVKELVEAMADNNMKEIRDALADILYVVYGTADAFGIDADADFAIVHNSNMSKLCSSEEEAKLTVADYEAKYQAKTSPYDSPYYYHLPQFNKWVVKNRSTGKVLKNINYQKVEWKD